MAAVIASHLVTRLVERHEIPAKVAVNLATATAEHATIGLASGLSEAARTRLIEDLGEKGMLTPSLLLRSISTGNFEFVTHALATMALGSRLN